MSQQFTIPVTRTAKSRLAETPLKDAPFGKYFTDHMLVAGYADGAWGEPRIVPYGPIEMDPSLAALHYGQSIFEGIKAYKDGEGNPFIFRPQANFRRFNRSAERMEMPPVPEAIFMEGMRQLVSLERDWIPSIPEHALYIRPLMFATDTSLGVKPSATYKFLIILNPTGPYYAAPMRIYVEETFTRAAPGGVGFAKNAGNYGGAMHPTTQAKSKGYDQVLWTDAFEHKWLQEVGTMNVFFVLGDKVVTPSLEEGTILAGVTRDSAITVLEEMGQQVEERRISIEELVEAFKVGYLREIFGTGTAATIARIRELCYRDTQMEFEPEKFAIAAELHRRLDAYRRGETPDTHGWMWPVGS